MSKSSDFILIKGATVLTVDSTNGNLDNCDILIQGDRIAAVAQNLPEPSSGSVTVIDAQDCIAIPGFIDGHHHMWQQLLRGVAKDWTLLDYTVQMRSIYGSLFTPEDVYLSTYIAALSLLNNGVTTVLEHCHIINSPAHADAAIKALKDAGIRSTFCYGFYPNPPLLGASDLPTENFSYSARLADAARVRKQYFGSNDPAEELVTFGVAPDEPEAQSIEQTKREIAESRELGARIITMHVAMGPYDRAHHHVVQQLEDAGVLGPDLVFSHGASFTGGELKAIRASGAGIVGTPDTELGMGMGFPIVFKRKIWGAMRLAIQAQRAQENENGLPVNIARKASDVLRMGTLGGAEVMRLDDLVGSITVGKKADIVLVRCDDIESLPIADPVGAVVFHTSLRHIDTVIVDGKVRKRNGELEVDCSGLKQEIKTRSAAIRANAATFDLATVREEWLKRFKGEF